MPNKAFAAKKDRQQKKRRIHNRTVKGSVRTSLKKIEVMVKDNASSEDLMKEYNHFQKICDKAAARNVFHKNTVARKKSRVAKLIKKG